MKEHHQRMEQEREMAQVKTEYLTQLKENGVDLTQYLIAVVGGMEEKSEKDNAKSDRKLLCGSNWRICM